MIDEDDFSTVALFGGIPILIVFIVLYFVFSVPRIEECHKSGGVIIKIEGESKCIAKESLKEVRK